MIRYGVLPVHDHDFNSSVDPFELDKAYWKTFSYEPPRIDSALETQR